MRILRDSSRWDLIEPLTEVELEDEEVEGEESSKRDLTVEMVLASRVGKVESETTVVSSTVILLLVAMEEEVEALEEGIDEARALALA